MIRNITLDAIHEGDCVDILPHYAGQVDLVLTSPPYDNLRTYGGHGFDWVAVADAIVLALKPGGVLVWVVGDATVDGSETGTSFRQALGFMARGLRLHDTMIYLKKGAYRTWAKRHSSEFEFMFVFSLGQPNTVNIIADRTAALPGSHGSYTLRRKEGGMETRAGKTTPAIIPRSNVWQYSQGHSQSAPDFLAAHDHPAIAPLALAKDHVTTWTNPGDLVLDPMGGKRDDVASG